MLLYNNVAKLRQFLGANTQGQLTDAREIKQIRELNVASRRPKRALARAPARLSTAAAENLARRLAALYPQETITAAVIDAELSQPALPVGGEEPRAEESLSAAVERHLSAYFGGFEDRLPPAGLYHRILREIEYPLLTAALAATRGNQIRAADLLGVNRNTLRKKIRDLDIQVFRGGS